MAPRQGACKRWCFTLNNYTEQQLITIQSFCESNSVYSIIGKEIGESGTPHLQGYVHLPVRKRFNFIKGALGDQAHIEPARGSPRQNRAYCSKDRDFWEFGTCPKSCRGSDESPSKLQEAAESFIHSMEEGKSIKEYMKDNPRFWIFHGKTMLDNYNLANQNPPYRNDIRVFWLYGPTGVGKSHVAFEVLGSNTYVKDPMTKWWHGYTNQPNAIIDDLGTDTIDVNMLLRWFHKFPCRVETKGGECALMVTTFIITSNFLPNAIYNRQIDALMRRMVVLHIACQRDQENFKMTYFPDPIDGESTDICSPNEDSLNVEIE